MLIILALTHISAFVGGAFAHRWLTKETAKVVAPDAAAVSTEPNE